MRRHFARLRLNSLRSRLMLLVALAITPTAVMTVLGGLQERQRAIKVSQENLQRLTGLAAANEAQSLASARQILTDLSSVPDLLGDTGKCSALLADVLKKNTGYVNFGLIQLNGDVSCSAVPMSQPVSLADRLHFTRAITERRFIAGGYVFGRVIQKHTINLTYPVIDRGGQVRAVVFAAMDLAELDTFVKDINLPQGSILVTADGSGKIISRRPDPEQWLGQATSAAMLDAMTHRASHPQVLEGPDGVERLHTFARVGATDLADYVVTIGIPVADITTAASRDQLMSLLGLATTLVLAMLASWFAGDVLIVRRVRKLMSTAEQIASGALGARTGIPYGREELGSLARALDDMALALQKKEAAHQRAELELRAADQRKDEFLAMLAHELRNPLAPISTGAQLLKRVHSDNAEIAQTCAIIVRQVDHMTSLVDDLLDVSRVTRGLVALSMASVDLTRVVEDAVEQIRPLIATRRHRLALHLPAAPAMVEGDHKRLVQVVANLLNNSTKYTPEGGNISLSLDLIDGMYELAVADDGIGMEAQLVERVFELFAQAERTADRSQGGLGLGLALVKSLVELHGGTVSAYSGGLGQGSMFSVRLPRLAAAFDAGAASGPSPALARGGALRLLVVDDNVDAVHTLQLLLGAAGHEVQVAYCATHALEVARVFSPHACLLDIGLPDFDGNQLARHLRAMPQAAGAVLIAMTGYGRLQDREAAMAAGFDHYLVKPVNTEQLAALLAGADAPTAS
jgi:signal transduction histidine kinase/ActR/RegA family two-component response regulator